MADDEKNTKDKLKSDLFSFGKHLGELASGAADTARGAFQKVADTAEQTVDDVKNALPSEDVLKETVEGAKKPAKILAGVAAVVAFPTAALTGAAIYAAAKTAQAFNAANQNKASETAHEAPQEEGNVYEGAAAPAEETPTLTEKKVRKYRKKANGPSL